MAQMVKNLSVMWETWVRSLGQEDPLEKEMATNSGILAWRLPWTEEAGGLESMWSQRVGNNWATNTFISAIVLPMKTNGFISPCVPHNCEIKHNNGNPKVLQIWPWSTKWSRSKTNRILTRECTGHSKQPLPTTQEKILHRGINRWSVWKSEWLYSL